MEYITPAALTESIRLLSGAPNVPFFYRPAAKRVLGEIEGIDLDVKGVTADEFALYLRLRRGNPYYRVVIVSHLDHPGFVIKGPNLAYPLGSVGWEGLSTGSSTAEPVRLKLYSKSGAFAGVAQVISVNDHIPALIIQSGDGIETNYQGMWDIPRFEIVDGNKIRMLSADNIVCTAAALAALAEVAKRPSITNVDLTLVLTFVEEVFQLSASGIAQRGCTPFFRFDQDTLIVNLEAMESECTPEQYRVIEQLGLAPPDYTSGVLLKINDLGMVYGQYFPSMPNLAEELLLKAVEGGGVVYQHTITAGVTDATAFSVFPTTRHIATLVIPCVNKHNWGCAGAAPVHEVVRVRDVLNVARLLFRAVEIVSEGGIAVTGRGLSEMLCKVHALANEEMLQCIKRDRLRALSAMGPRLASGKFFPENWKEQVEFTVARACSRAQFEISKFGRGGVKYS